jgi:hypothetical protein
VYYCRSAIFFTSLVSRPAFNRVQRQTFSSRLSCYRFVQPAQALLNSTPELLARDRRAVAQGAQLTPAIADGEFHVARAAYRYECDLSPIATSSGNLHDLAVLRNSAGESVWTINEPRCSCSRSNVTNSAANSAAEAKNTESAPRSLCCAPRAAA